MVEFVVPRPNEIVAATNVGAFGRSRFTAFARAANEHHERLRLWRVSQKQAGKSQDYIDAKFNDFLYLLNEALVKAGELLDNPKQRTRCERA